MISQAAWNKYIKKLEAIDKKAADSMNAWVEANGLEDDHALIQYAYALATHYGEASATLSCEMYDTMSHIMKAGVPDAVPAETATYEEVAKGMMYGKYHSPSQIPDIVGRQVRQAGADTMIQNAARDNAEWAWVPQGDTCAFCITLASNGWQPASKAVLNGNHADHIHQNCDCTFAIAFRPEDRKQYDKVYDPNKYKDMYYGADGKTPNERINYIRRQIYERDKDEINAQKRDAYQAKKLNEKETNEKSSLKQIETVNQFSQSNDIYNPFEDRDSQDGFTDHTKKRQRKEERNISDQAINHVIKHPINNPEETLEYDKYGRPSMTYIGEKITVIRNPENGAIITSRRTTKKERDRWKNKE